MKAKIMSQAKKESEKFYQQRTKIISKTHRKQNENQSEALLILFLLP